METLAILKGQHERGVCSVDFSGDHMIILAFKSGSVMPFDWNSRRVKTIQKSLEIKPSTTTLLVY